MTRRANTPLIRPIRWLPEPLATVQRRWSRRRTLQGVGALVGGGLVGGCDDSGGGSGGTGDTGGTGSESGDAAALCAAVSDLPPAELLGEIDTIVVIMMENRSFDHYFGSLSLLENSTLDGLDGTEVNPDPSGAPVGVYNSDLWVVEEDPPHGWDASHAQWNNGNNDGFVREHVADGAKEGRVVMGYHTREQLPVLHTFADEYVACDRWFSSVMGPTWPNRWHLHLGTSAEYMDNPDSSSGLEDLPNIFTAMQGVGLDSRYYNSGLLPFTLTYGRAEGIVKIEQFFEDAAAGNLPPLCVVEPVLTARDTIGNDDHPPADIRMGQAFLATIYQALAQSPHWERCLLVITYDEHGGFYDHVAPPTTVDSRPGFEQLGFRVPAVVIGPHVRRGCVNSLQFDHVSVASTLTARFGAAPLNDRVTRTNDLSSVIDPTYLGAPRAAAPLPPVEIALDPSQSHRHLGRDFGGQTELWDLADRGGFPRHLDRRGEVDDVMAALLHHGQRLGAIKLV